MSWKTRSCTMSESETTSGEISDKGWRDRKARRALA